MTLKYPFDRPVQGIDVSKYQGAIDWPAVAGSGVKHAMLRIGYGRYDHQIDQTFETNYKAARTAGVAVGGYWYSYATSTAQAEAEAQCCLRAIRGKQFELPIAYDIEYEPGILALTNTQRTALVHTFLGAIERSGYYGILYASTDFIKNRLNWRELARYDVWAAQYAVKCTCPLPYGIWQYTSSGNVPGIAGRVDCNWLYKDYPAIIKGAGLNGYSKGECGQPGGDGSNAEQDRPPENLPQEPDKPLQFYRVDIESYMTIGDANDIVALAESRGLKAIATAV